MQDRFSWLNVSFFVLWFVRFFLIWNIIRNVVFLQHFEMVIQKAGFGTTSFYLVF